jgi:photosynthetic reaction center cytochrome c subunit
MNPVRLFFAALLIGAVAIFTQLAGFHRTEVVQRGYRGTAMNELYRESTFETLDKINTYPKPLGPAKTDGPKAAETYENVQVLGDLSKAQFARTMLSIKAWVAPEVGCNLCHAAPVYNSDEKYTKRVARQMLIMVRHINTDWTQHVGKTGVTCYTCHRGNQVPQKLWWSSTPKTPSGLMLQKSAMRLPTAASGNTALPNDALTDYLLHDNPIRVQGTQPLAGANRNSVWHARDTYGLMMVMSESLGVNCTFCHNTRSAASWETSTPQRVTAWYGIRMVRDLNNSVELTLKGTLPPDRLGPTGDTPKIYCATCHQGANKPLYGAPMLKYYPELVRPQTADAAVPPTQPASPESATPAATPVPSAPPAPVKTAQARQPLILVSGGG